MNSPHGHRHSPSRFDADAPLESSSIPIASLDISAWLTAPQLRQVTTDGSDMAVLSLFEAAEQAATSRVDIWRAIQEGALPAQKTSGGYAINATDLFRVFERRQPEPRLTPPNLTPAPDEARAAKTDEASEQAATNEVSVAFAALQTELKSLLGALGEAASTGEKSGTTNAKRARTFSLSRTLA
jgi:hypothetical protein